jgi:hypothetical protein
VEEEGEEGFQYFVDLLDEVEMLSYNKLELPIGQSHNYLAFQRKVLIHRAVDNNFHHY